MSYIVTLLITGMIYSVTTLSVDLVQGEAGIFTIAQTAFMGVGAFTTADLSVKLGVPVLLTFPVAALAGLIVAAIVFAPVARLSGLVQALITFSFVVVMQNVFEAANVLTGGSYGIAGIPFPSIGGVAISSPLAQLALYLVIASIPFLAVIVLKRSPYGLAIKAGRESAPAARAGGRSVKTAQFAAFALGGAIAGVSGAMYAMFISYIDPTPFSVDLAFLVVLMLIFGGTGNIAGVIVGAMVLSLLPNLLTYLPLSSAATGAIAEIIYGVAILIVIRKRPAGLLPERIGMKWRSFADQRGTASESSPATAESILAVASAEGPAPVLEAFDSHATSTGHYLEASDVRREFGGLVAVNDVSFGIASGEHVAIIGANGAGKTTLVNILSGFDRSDGGAVLLGGMNLSGKNPEQIARAGICRTFQDVKLFNGLTVAENLLAYALPTDHMWLPSAAIRGRAGYPEESLAVARKAVRHLGLEAKADIKVSSLSYGEQKLVSIGRILCARWDVLFLDEPMSGLSLHEMEVVSTLIREVAGENRTIVLIEHNMEFVFGFARRIIVMDRGRIIADGIPSDIREDRLVRSAYLGGTESEVA